VVVATRTGDATVVAANGTVAVRDGDELRTSADGTARLTMPRNVRVDLGVATKLWVDQANEAEQHLRLDLGHVAVAVPNPGGPRTVAFTTPDSEVIVHGTKFTVDVARNGADGTITSVTVTRGSVLVVHGADQRLIEAGHHWSSAESAGQTAEARNRRPASASAARGTPSRVPRRALPVDGSLTDQNRLFQAALDARAAGDDETVIRQLDLLLARYPESTLAPEARLLRLRSLRRASAN
jgi:hypothetical protein